MVTVYFRAAHLYHDWGMEVFKPLLPALLFSAEMVIIFGLFLSIRFHTHDANEPIFSSLAAVSIGGLTLFILRRAFEVGVNLMETSQDFSRIPFLQKGCSFETKDRLVLASCKPLVLKVGEVFLITKETFPTILQDIILGNLINLLITF